MIELCESFDVAYVPVLTKSDKVSKNILMKTTFAPEAEMFDDK